MDRIQGSVTYEMFATPVWIVDLASEYAASLNARLTADIYKINGPIGALTPGRTNWQTPTNLQQRPQFAELVELFEKAGIAAADYLKLRCRDLVVTGCWANVNPPGGHNPSHAHPNNYLSGVYYVTIPEGEGKIQFEDPRVQAQVMMPAVTEFTPHNGNCISLTIKPGRLLVFPAWLSHSVPANRSSENRISISFNLMFKDYARDVSPTLWEGTEQGTAASAPTISPPSQPLLRT